MKIQIYIHKQCMYPKNMKKFRSVRKMFSTLLAGKHSTFKEKTPLEMIGSGRRSFSCARALISGSS